MRKYGPGHALAGQDHKGGKKPIKSRVGFNCKVNELEGSQWENEKKIGQHYAAVRVDKREFTLVRILAPCFFTEKCGDEDLNEGLLHLQQELRRIEQEVSRRQQRRQQQAQQDAATVTSDSDNAKTDLETEIDTVCR